jgi:hypothetical protein
MLRQQQFGLLGINLVLSGCVLVPPQLSPPSHLVTIEPDGSVVKDECVLPRQTLVPSERIECLENGVKVIQECHSKGCTYTRDGKLFRQCIRVRYGIFSMEKECIENGVHVSRKCKRGWSTVTCTEALLK